MEDVQERMKKLERSTKNHIQVVNNEEISEDEFDHVPVIETANELMAFEKKLKNSSFFKQSVISKNKLF